MGAPAVCVQNLAKTYKNIKALAGVSLEIDEGEFFGLLGPNGAGKTTLISILAGLVRATSGKVLVHGHDVQEDFAQARRLLGIVPQELVFDPFFTVREALRIQSGYFGIHHNDEWIEELLENLGLTEKANTNMRALSGGMKRRALVGLALVHRPPVIVLDEPTAGVDVQLRQSLWAFIGRLNQRGHTVVLTTHYLEEAEALCTRVAMLQKGEVVALESTSALLRAAAHSVLRFRLDGPLPLQMRPRARVVGRIVQLPVSGATQIEQYLAQVREAGLVAQDVQVRTADLEDVFLDVMGKERVTGEELA